MNKQQTAFAAVLILLSVGISGCCSSGSGCGLLGKRSVAPPQTVTPAACTTCSSPGAMDQYHASATEVADLDLAPARVAQRTEQLLPSWVGSSPGSSSKSCGST